MGNDGDEVEDLEDIEEGLEENVREGSSRILEGLKGSVSKAQDHSWLIAGTSMVALLFLLVNVPVDWVEGSSGNNTSIPEPPELTRYQKDYVDCPERYLDTCTEMSKIPTEEVSFWKTQDDRLFLKMEDGRAIVSTLPNGTAGEFVTIMSAAEVPNSTSG